MSFAANTKVSVEKTRMEIDTLLGKHGAKQRMVGQDDDAAVGYVVFTLGERSFKIHVPIPRSADFRLKDPTRHAWGSNVRTKLQIEEAWKQGVRQRWRQILLLVKAKLEAIALGTSTAEREFMADILMEGGQTLHQILSAQSWSVPPLQLGMGASES